MRWKWKQYNPSCYKYIYMSIICCLPAVYPVLCAASFLLPFEPASLGSSTVWPCHFTSWNPWVCSSLILWVRFTILQVLKQFTLHITYSRLIFKKIPFSLTRIWVINKLDWADFLLKTSYTVWAGRAGKAEQQDPGVDKQTLVHLVLHLTQMCLDSLSYPTERHWLAKLKRTSVACLTLCTHIIRSN